MSIIKIALLEKMNLQSVLELDTRAQVVSAMDKEADLKRPLEGSVSFDKELSNSCISRLEKCPEKITFCVEI